MAMATAEGNRWVWRGFGLRPTRQVCKVVLKTEDKVRGKTPMNRLPKTNEQISIAESLPLELKTELIDRLLDSLNPSREEIDESWAREAERRVEELETGKVNAIPGEEVFREIRDRLSV